MAFFGLFFRHTALFILRLSIQIKYKPNALSDEKIASKSTHFIFPDKSIVNLSFSSLFLMI